MNLKEINFTDNLNYNYLIIKKIINDNIKFQITIYYTFDYHNHMQIKKTFFFRTI